MLRVIRDLFDRIQEVRDAIRLDVMGTLNSNHAMFSEIWLKPCKVCLAKDLTIELLKHEVDALRGEKDRTNEVLFRALKLETRAAPIVRTANEELTQQQSPNPRNWGKVKSALEDRYKRPDQVADYWKAQNAKTEQEIPELIEALAKEEQDLDAGKDK